MYLTDTKMTGFIVPQEERKKKTNLIYTMKQATTGMHNTA